MTALLLVLAVIGTYLIACRIWPYLECGRCNDGRRPSPSGKAFRHCSRCGGTGRKRRLFAGKPTQGADRAVRGGHRHGLTDRTTK